MMLAAILELLVIIIINAVSLTTAVLIWLIGYILDLLNPF